MSVSQKTKLTNVFTLLVLALTTFQGLIPAMPIQSVTLVSGITMFLVSGLTAWKQYLSVEIDNSSLSPTLFVAILATLGGLNDLFNVVHISGSSAQWIRFGITFATAFINLASKILWPTPDTKSKV